MCVHSSLPLNFSKTDSMLTNYEYFIFEQVEVKKENGEGEEPEVKEEAKEAEEEPVVEPVAEPDDIILDYEEGDEIQPKWMVEFQNTTAHDRLASA